MRRQVESVAALAAGYVLGSFPSAAAAARASGGDHDLEVEGTGNPGAMNASHVLGRKWGMAVTVADVGKGVVASRVGMAIAGPAGANVAATAAVLGHCHPPGRAGGKGVATSIGQVIGTFPAYLPVDVLVGYVSTKLPISKHRTRAATGWASAVWVGCATVAWRRGYRNPGGPPVTAALPVGAAVSSLVIAQRFRVEAARVTAYNDAIEVE